MKRNSTIIATCIIILVLGITLGLAGCSLKEATNIPDVAENVERTTSNESETITENNSELTQPAIIEPDKMVTIKTDEIMGKIQSDIHLVSEFTHAGERTYKATADGSDIYVNEEMDNPEFVQSIKLEMPFYTINGFEEAATVLNAIYPEWLENTIMLYGFERQLTSTSVEVAEKTYYGNTEILAGYYPELSDMVYITIIFDNTAVN